METRKLLVDSVQNIAELKPGQASSDAATAAFISFRKGVTHASSSRTESLQDLLGDLEPKDEVLRFLVDFHAQRRIFRKQIVGIVEELLRVHPWRRTLVENDALRARLPDDLAKLLTEAQARPEPALKVLVPVKVPVPVVPVPLPVPVPVVPAVSSERRSSSGSCWPAEGLSEKTQAPAKRMSSGSCWPAEGLNVTAPSKPPQTPVAHSANKAASRPAEHSHAQERNERRRQRLSEACMLPIRVAGGSGTIVLSKHELGVICDLLEHGRKQIESLGFSAADADPAISAFETFRRAVQQAANSAVGKQDDDHVLEQLESKGKILDFLVDMYERHQKYRSRVTSTLTRLLNFDSWNTAADYDEQRVQEPDVASRARAPAESSTACLGAGAPAKWTPWGPVVPSAPSSAGTPSKPRANPFRMPSDPGSVGTVSRPRPRNPFASDVAAKRAGYPGGDSEIWSGPSDSIGTWQKPTGETDRSKIDPSPTSACMSPLASASTLGSGPWGGPSPRRLAKPTNPFGPSLDVKCGMTSPVKCGASAAATNPFKKDLDVPAPQWEY